MLSLRTAKIQLYTPLTFQSRALMYFQQQIEKEQYTLKKMHHKETALTNRHKLLMAEVQRLTNEADEVSTDLYGLRGRYTRQIKDLRVEYKENANRVKDQREVAEKELKQNKVDFEALEAKVAAEMKKSAYFEEQAMHREEDVEAKKSRIQEDRVCSSLPFFLSSDWLYSCGVSSLSVCVCVCVLRTKTVWIEAGAMHTQVWL